MGKDRMGLEGHGMSGRIGMEELVAEWKGVASQASRGWYWKARRRMERQEALGTGGEAWLSLAWTARIGQAWG